VYVDADLYLLDDPLAAVDAHVGQHLFTKCIQPLQRANKCILLVTNALQYVKHCSAIMVVKNGRIVEAGMTIPAVGCQLLLPFDVVRWL
jgi:ABC-type transport system involved in cytochrome bd biosynthesis fused ATPase/permease subunit